MNRIGRAGLLLVIGAAMGRLLWSGGYGWFVQQHMRVPLIAATAVLLLLGIYEAIAGSRQENLDPASTRRAAGPAVGWLLILPIVVLVSVAPTGLGASAADRVDAHTPTESSSPFSPLDSSGPVEMRVFDFLERAVWDESQSLQGVTARLEGLVVNDPEFVDGFLLTRFMVSCCAADGIPLQVAVHTTSPLEDDTWVVADVIWRLPEVPYEDAPTPWFVEADAVSVTVVPNAPNDPYESPY